MKKSIIGFIFGFILALTITVGAQTYYQFIMSDNVLYVNGVKVEMPMYNYEYTNYASIRGVAEALGLDITVTGKRIDLTSKADTSSNGSQNRTSMESTIPAPVPKPEPDPEYLKLLRENGVNVSTEDEFMQALETANVIIVKKNITLDTLIVELKNINVLVIDEGVTLKITTPNFYADCKIVNFGEILIADHGRMLFSFEPDYTMLGKIRTGGKNNEISFSMRIDRKDAADDIAYFLHPNSIYTTLEIGGYSSVGELAEIIIDKDITIPAGKTLWISYNSVLRVNKGVSLTNNGTIICYNQPIVEGKISGIGKEMVYRQ